MAERINLAQFDIDTRLLEEKIANNQTKMDLLKGEIRDTRKVLKEYQDQAKLAAGVIVETTKVQEQANEQLRQGTITQEQYNAVISETSQVIRQSETELSRLLELEREQQQQLVRNQSDLRRLNEENRELNNLFRAGREELSGLEGQYQELQRQWNATAAESRNLGVQMRELERSGQQNTEEYRQVSETYRQTAQRALELRTEMRELTAATGDNSLNVGNYAEGFETAFSELSEGAGMLMSGNVQGGFESVKNGLKGIKGGFSDLFSFIKANPWLVIVGAIFTYVKEMYEYNQQVRELNMEVEALANTSGELTDQLRKNATAISETYGKDFKEAVIEQKSLMDDFKISAEEAFNVYNEGLARGGALNSEFGDSIREYGPLLAQSGYSAQEFINILNAGIDLGIYNDKLPDAIKEAGISLNEQTKATRDALVNAFGASFTDDLLKRIQSGKTTVADGLDEIAQKAEKTNLNQQQLAQLTADVFKGAGEDAGGALKIFEALNHAVDISKVGLTDLQKEVVRLAQLDKELADAKDEAFKSDSVMAFQADIEVAWKQIQIIWYKSLGNITTFINDASKGWRLFIMNTSDLFKLIPNTFNKVVTAVAKDLAELTSLAKLSGEIIKDALTLNLDGIEDKFNKLKSGISNAFSNTKKEIKIFSSFLGTEGIINVKNRNIIADEEAAKIEAKRQREAEEAARKAADEATRKGNGKVTGSVADAAAALQSKALKDLEKQKAEQQKKIEEAAKAELANAKERADQATQNAQNELANYIAINAEKLKSDKRLTQERINEINKYYDELEKKQLEALAIEEKSKIDSLNAEITKLESKGKLNAQELEQKRLLENQKNIIVQEYDTKEIQVKNQTKDEKLKVDKTYLEQKKEMEDLASALAFQKKILDLEEQGASEFDIRKAQEEQRFQEELRRWAEENDIKMDLDNDRYISDQEIQMERDALQLQYETTKDESEKLRIQNQLNSIDNMVRTSAKNQEEIEKAKENAKLQAISNTLGQAASLFAENTAAYKALSIAQAAINTYLGVSGVLAQFPGPVGWAMSAVQIALGLANVAKIAGIGVNKKAARGMIPDGPSHQNGGIKAMTPNGMIEIEGGEAIINKKSTSMYRNLLSEINQAGGGVKFAMGGIGGGISSLPTVQNTIKQNLDMALMSEMISAAVLEGSMTGTQMGSQQGIIGLSENRQIQQGANF